MKSKVTSTEELLELNKRLNENKAVQAEPFTDTLFEDGTGTAHTLPLLTNTTMDVFLKTLPSNRSILGPAGRALDRFFQEVEKITPNQVKDTFSEREKWQQYRMEEGFDQVEVAEAAR